MNNSLRTLTIILAGALSSTTSAQPAESPAFEITVHNPGRSPRQTLVYNIPPGSNESIAMAIELDQSVNLGGSISQSMNLPKMQIEIDAQNALEAKPATIEAEFQFSEISLSARDTSPAGIVEALQPALAGFGEISGHLTLSDSGRVLDLAIRSADGAPEIFESTLTQVVNSFRGAIIPLPGVPVGIGASWTVAMEIDFPQFVMRQETLYTLRSIEGDTITLDVQIGQSAPGAGPIADEDDEWNNDISEVAGGGGGQVILSLKRITPIKTDITVENRVIVNSSKSGGNTTTTIVESKTHVVTESRD